MRFASIPRVTALGAGAAVAALLLWLAFINWPSSFVLLYVAALIVTASSGLYILLASYVDSVRNPRRGVRIRPIRGFDVAAGLLLAGPSLWALSAFWPAL